MLVSSRIMQIIVFAGFLIHPVYNSAFRGKIIFNFPMKYHVKHRFFKMPYYSHIDIVGSFRTVDAMSPCQLPYTG